ncbi:hypothetical protein ACJIZ3_010408 [Penstemon smallii]|uniref:Uncharacterized protein n=1 Tax=Penstemon smallii TaxID=265156 RepID=A0ABD3TH80_9LAMI
MRILNFIWMLPLKIMKSKISTRTKPRRRPLHTCGASFQAIANYGCTKAQSFDDPLGSIAKKAIIIFNSFFPFIYIIFHQWLAMLSFIDDLILTVENLLEIVFPRSKYIFDKIDALVYHAEVSPEKLDDIWRKIPIIHHIGHRGLTVTNEKEIMIDLNCTGVQCTKSELEEISAIDQSHSSNVTRHFKEIDKSYSFQEKENEARNCIEPSIARLSEVIHKSVKRLHSLENKRKNETYCVDESPTYGAFKSAVSSPMWDGSDSDEISSFNQKGKSETLKCTYKEMLKKGQKEEAENKKESLLKDQILELFEEWHLK